MDLISMAALSAGASTPVTDEYWDNVVLALNQVASDAQQNQSFDDESTANHVITANGDVTQGTFSPFSPNGWGVKFTDSGTTRLIASSNSAFDLDSTNYTVEFFITFTSGPTTNIFCTFNSGTGNYPQFIYYAGILLWQRNGTSAFDTSGAFSPVLGQKYHIAVGWNGSTCSIWVDGTRIGTSSNNPAGVGQNGLQIGGRSDGYGVPGVMSNFRVTKADVYGAANASITIPTEDLTDIANTSILACMSNRFIDISSNAHTLSVGSNPSIIPSGPFGATEPWSAASHGGSGYFDGTGDYLTVADSPNWELGISNEVFTFEMWFYNKASGGVRHLAHFGGPNNTYDGTNGIQWRLLINASSQIQFQGWTGATNFNSTGSTNPRLDEWNHIAVSYDGTNTRVWLNGATIITGAWTYGQVTNAATLYIGHDRPGSGSPFNGYISSFRIVKGTEHYDASSSTITVPTAPLTAIANTVLLLNFTNAGVYDAAAKHVVILQNNAQTDTASPRYASAAILFDGTSDYIDFLASALFNLGNADFTIEGHFKTSNKTLDSSINRHMFMLDGPTAAAAGNLEIAIDSNGYILTGFSSDYQTGSTDLADGAWHHLAYVNDNGTLRCYIDGVQVTTDASFSALSPNSGQPRPRFGSYTGSTGDWDGQLEDWRIYAGVCKYPSGTTFTPPVRTLPVQGA